MRSPHPRGTVIDNHRFDEWLAQFAGYSNPLTRLTLELWLEQFRRGDRDMAARVLDSVFFVGVPKLISRYGRCSKLFRVGITIPTSGRAIGTSSHFRGA